MSVSHGSASEYEVFICHRGPDTKLDFCSTLKVILNDRGIKAFFDNAMEGGSNATVTMERAKQQAQWGVVVLSPRFFESQWCMEELKYFLDQKQVLPVTIGLEIDECKPDRIVNQENATWQKHGGRLWEKCGMEEGVWRDVVTRVSEVVVVKEKDHGGEWGKVISELARILGEKLGKRPQGREALVRRSPNPAPKRNMNFLGRESEISTLERVFDAEGEGAQVMISSIAGMGKTQLASEYVHRHRKKYGKVFWLNGSRQGLQADYLGLAPFLDVHLAGDEGEAQGQIQEALEKLDAPCFLVFDNVEDQETLQPLLPTCGPCKVLVTTRLRDMRDFEVIALGKLSKEDALSLARGSRTPGPYEEQLQALASRFGYLTLALAVCRGLHREGMTPKRLLGELEGHPYCEPVKDFSDGQHYTNLPPETNQDLFKLFELSIEQIQKDLHGSHSALAERVVWAGGWFEGVPIGIELLACAAELISEDGNSREDVPRAITLLTKYNLAEEGAAPTEGIGGTGGTTVVFHSLVQSFGRAKGGPRGGVTVVKALAAVGDPICDAPHFQKACDLAMPPRSDPGIVLDRSTEVLVVEKVALPLVHAYLSPFFQPAQALKVVTKCENTISNEEPLLVAEVTDSRAKVYRAQGRLVEALPYYEKTLALYEEVLGSDHPLVAEKQNNLAVLCESQGDYERARRLQETARGIRERRLRTDHPAIATSLHNLAELHRRQGEFAEALPLYQQALAKYEEALGHDNLYVAAVLSGLGGLHTQQGEYEEALQRYEEAITVGKKVWGPEHPKLATMYNNLAGLYQLRGEYDRALEYYEKDREICNKVLEPAHPDVAITLQNMAFLHLQQGKIADSIATYERALVINEEAFGLGHPFVVTARENLVKLLEEHGEYAKAVLLLERSLASRGEGQPLDATKVTLTLAHLIELHERQGNVEEANVVKMQLMYQMMSIRDAGGTLEIFL